ncbi:MAG: VOC family protein [Acidimicrobiales bacterium]
MIPDITLDHVAVAAERQADLWPRYAGDLAGAWIGGGRNVGFASAQVRFANGMKLEALEPNLPEQNDFLRRFLDHSGPGPHHLTFKVADIIGAMELAERAGYRPVGVDLSEPHWKEAFLHPKDAPGVVVQLAQSAGDWDEEPRPARLPPPRTATPATLVHVAHCVASMAEGLALFAGLLGGQELGRGTDAAYGGREWVDLAWSGAGRVRLMAPIGPASELVAWLRSKAGRVHHIHFECDDPGAIPGAKASGDTDNVGANPSGDLSRPHFEVAPGDNYGVALVLDDTTLVM